MQTLLWYLNLLYIVFTQHTVSETIIIHTNAQHQISIVPLKGIVQWQIMSKYGMKVSLIFYHLIQYLEWGGGGGGLDRASLELVSPEWCFSLVKHKFYSMLSRCTFTHYSNVEVFIHFFWHTQLKQKTWDIPLTLPSVRLRHFRTN